MSKQAAMLNGIAVDAASGFLDQGVIPEISDQRVVVRCQRASARQYGQRQNMVII
jgi:hypothetical protein